MSMSSPPDTHAGRSAARAAQVAATRRQLLGIGIASAVGVGGAAALVGTLVGQPAPDGTAAGAAGPAGAWKGGGAGGGRAPGAPAATPWPTTPPADLPVAAPPAAGKGVPVTRPVATTPFAAGGPASRDQSTAGAVPAAAPALPPGQQYTGFEAAAAAATPVASAVFDVADAKAHLLRRATFGPRPADQAELAELGIDAWLSRQLSPDSIDDREGDAAWNAFPLAGADPDKIRNSSKEFSWDAMTDTSQAALARQIFSRKQLFEVVADVFSNHLHVALPSEQWNTAPKYITDVIRANITGTFRDMLLASMRHPAMLGYLNNNESTKEHVNENLGRELLELHTVGIAGGYSEMDVVNSARILSGRTFDYESGKFEYDPNRHYTGAVTVIGFESANDSADGGLEMGDEYLRYLAVQPSTAREVARKIATRFIADQPSDDLLDRLAAVYLENDTNILAVVRAVFLSSDFWSATGMKLRRPLEDAVGAARVLDVTMAGDTKKGVESIYWNLWEAGHTPFAWAPPNGYPDVAAAWMGAGGMIQRWNLHRSLVNGWNKELGYTKPEELVPRTEGMTAGDWVAAIALRLAGTAISADHLAVLLAFLETDAAAPAADVEDWKVGDMASLVLDSGYFQLR